MNTNIPQLLSAVRLCDPCRAPKQPLWIAICTPCFCVFDCCFIQQFHSTTPLAKLTRNPERSLVPTLSDFVTLLSHFGYFPVRLTSIRASKASVLSKHWEFATVWPLLKPILFWRGETATQLKGSDRIPSTNPGAEPPRDARDSGSARSHSTHLETSSSNRP